MNRLARPAARFALPQPGRRLALIRPPPSGRRAELVRPPVDRSAELVRSPQVDRRATLVQLGTVGLLAAAVAGSAWPSRTRAQAGAQDWPSKTVRIVVPYSPGTGIDILARTLGPPLGERWGHPVVVDNRPGASGNIGAALVVAAQADGHTLLMGVNTLIINPSLYTRMSYDPYADLAPIGLAANGTFLVVAHPKLGMRKLDDLLAGARQRPGALDYGSPGIATPHHMGMELLKARAKVALTHIPFSNTGGAVAALLSGDVPLMFLPVHVAMAQVKSGRLVALATAGPRRSPLAPEVPTLAEQGLTGVDADLWYGLLGPAKLPPPLVTRIHDAMNAVLATPQVAETLVAQGMEVRKGTAAQMAELMRRDGKRWADLIRTAGIKVEQ